MKVDKITLSKVYRLLGAYDHEERDAIRIEYGNVKNNKPSLTINDWLWGKLQSMAIDTKAAPEIYWMMSQFVTRFEGKSGLMYDKLAIKARYQQDRLKLNNDRLEWNAKVIGDLECHHGKKSDGQDFKLDENFNPAELAGENCNKLKCRCIYSIVPKRDNHGRLIWKV